MKMICPNSECEAKDFCGHSASHEEIPACSAFNGPQTCGQTCVPAELDVKETPAKLKPCPFCGNNRLDDDGDIELGIFYVTCQTCAADGPFSILSAADARKTWNARKG